MPTALKTTTASLTLDEPHIIAIAGVSYETKGGTTITQAITMRQIEVDGVTQKITGLDFVESTSIMVSATLIAIPNATIQSIFMFNATPTGTAPVQTWDTPAVNKLLPAGAYGAAMKVLRRRRGDTVWTGFNIPYYLVTDFKPTSGTSGDGAFAITVESRIPSTTPYASHWQYINDPAPTGF